MDLHRYLFDWNFCCCSYWVVKFSDLNDCCSCSEDFAVVDDSDQFLFAKADLFYLGSLSFEEELIFVETDR